MEYLVYCDESAKSGRYFGNFYGAALVRSKDYEPVVSALESTKTRLGFTGEVKWQKVSEQYLDRYIALMDVFMGFVRSDSIKIRLMFTQNMYRPVLREEQRKKSFFLLYYQFLKHAFGWQASNETGEPIRVKLFLDELPDRKSVPEFKRFLARLSQQREMRAGRVSIAAENICEVESHNHVILQCLDVVLGAMAFRLNDMHLEKPRGARHRGSRTRAKEKLYKFLNREIREMYPGFNIGISTGGGSDPALRWRHSYRHWRFVPNEHKLDTAAVKPKSGNNKNPVPPTSISQAALRTSG